MAVTEVPTPPVDGVLVTLTETPTALFDDAVLANVFEALTAPLVGATPSNVFEVLVAGAAPSNVFEVQVAGATLSNVFEVLVAGAAPGPVTESRSLSARFDRAAPAIEIETPVPLVWVVLGCGFHSPTLNSLVEGQARRLC